MQHQRLRLAAGLLTFFVGASRAYEWGQPGPLPDRGRRSAKCRLDFGNEYPVVSFLHPCETAESMWTARRAG